VVGSAEVRRRYTSKPYITVSRGEEFADSFNTRFFAKTFLTLFPLGNGGPRQAKESVADIVESKEEEVDCNTETTVCNLMLSRNISLEI